MCVTYCHRRKILYWDHEDCHPAECGFVQGPHGACADCRHQQGNICGLTNTPLPQSGGCCHYNVAVIQGDQRVTPAMVQLLGLDAEETMAEALEGRNVRYHLDAQISSIILIDPDELPVPTTYGRGTDHQIDEALDWSGWFEQWNDETENEFEEPVTSSPG